ncbi:choice-of-anchor I domain-containing protein [Cyanobacterium aponinum]|uniref:choice-of-anchor I domain-containing protein n=1 Tax=Cyanobacterium aponinum TaxID=379064 RepID=UPI0026BBA5B9
MTINLNLIGTYATGQFDEGAAEIPAFDPSTNRLFVVNSQAVTVDVLDLSDPNNPVKIGEIDASALGGVANSVAVKNGIVAIAIEANIKTDNGSVAFFNSDSDFSNPVNPVNTVTVGALPDMVTFTPDGMKVLTANEGEANDDYSVDPEGSISIIDISTGVENASVTNANFNAFDSQKDALVAQGVRIFGLNASVSQDLEPEYIAFSADSQTAYVTLQENNALAVVDVTTGTVSGIVPLGFKNYNASPNLETAFFEESELPIIGTSQTRGDIRLGGFSGLTFLGMNDSGNYEFLTHMDLGPSETGNRDINDDGVEERVRTYLIPDLQPRLVKFEYNPNNGDTNILDQVLLTRQDGSPLTGLPNLPTDDGGRIPIDEDGNILDFDPLGADLEGLIQAPDGTFWAADEYRPALYKFSAEGVLIDRFVPEGLPAEVGTGVFPEAYNTRQANRGFEAIAFQDGKVYAFVQSPFDNPDSGETATTRILEFDPVSETVTGEYLYIQEDIGGGSDKIGDAVATNKNGEFLVIERDSSLEADSQKVIFRINLNDATNLQTLPDDVLEGDETFDSLTPEELAQKGINPVTKEVAINLTEIGYDFTDKPEGLTVIDETTIAVINDNDFDEAGIPIGLGIISLNNALDASNRDDSINIRNWPVFGMYQPDAIASYEVDGQTYLVTANEGDARIRPDGDLEDDQGNVIIEEGEIFNEENRINDIILDPVAFPNARQLQENDQLGRLNITNTLGVSDRAIFVAELTPDQEVPPAMSDAEGESFAFVDDNGFLNVELQVTGVDFGAVTGNPLTADTGDDVILLHIHEAMRGMNGGVVWDLLADPDTEILIDNEGNATLTSIWQESDIPKTPQGEDTNYYFNLHTERNPGGELRGQIQGEIAYEELYAYGSRSFSIWDSNGNLVFDSGDDFEQITASLIPNDFNSNNDENGSFDARSDDKGPEPEGVTVGEINGVPYAFVGLERVGGVMVYDISDPTDAKFVQYINNRDFSVDAQLEDGSPNPEAGDLGPEGLVFISAEDSPNGIPLLVVANEVSGTTSVYEIDDGFTRPNQPSQMKGLGDFVTEPVFTIGQIFNGSQGYYVPPGILDGLGAFALDEDTIRVLANHELGSEVGYAYTLANGTQLTGGRISFFDINKDTRQLEDVGQAYDTIINRAGEVVDEASDLDFMGLDRLCSAQYIEANQFGEGRGLVDGLFFTGEETDGGSEFVLDPETNTLYAVPWMGRAAWESVTELDTGTTDKVALLIGDDRGGAPLLLYVGEKGQGEGADILIRNGLAQGKLYVWVADSGETTPEQFNGTNEQRSGSFVEIDFYRPDLAGNGEYDELGFATQEKQDALAEEVGAFKFSRPEDLATSPDDGTVAVLASTGRDSLFPSDSWGTTYEIDADFSDLDNITAQLDVLYDGDDAGNGQFAGPDFGLRSPDNLEWADNGLIYIQEDRSIDEFGLTSGEEASIWELNPETGVLNRIAQIDRTAVPEGQTDGDPDDIGDWESSGIIDVSNLFDETPGSLFLFDVQAHSIRDGIIAEEGLVQGGQLAFLENTNPTFTLQLLHTSDQEAGIPALQDAIGFSAVLNALDAQYLNTLKLSSGDLFIAGPFFNASRDIYGEVGIADILIQNELGWDAAAVGNHEFDAGPEAFYNAIAPNADIQGTGIDPTTGFTGANFPYLSTNLDYSTDSSDLKDLVVPAGEAPESASLTESVVVDVNGEQIGVIGAVVPYLPQIANIGGITMLTDPNSRDIEENAQAIADSVQPFVDELVAQGINKIVLMTHLQQFEVEQALASKLRHVDILMGGGSHRVMANDDDTLRQDETQTPPELLQPYPQVFQDADGNDIYLINTAANYRYVGQLIVDFDAEGNIISVGDESGAFATDIAGVDRLYEADITTFEQVKAVADPELVEIVDGVGDFINGKDGNIFGNTEVWLNGLRSSVRTEETNLGNLTADANLWYAEQYGLEIDISVKNGGGIRDQIGVSFIDGGTNELIQLPPQANPAVGKEEGDVSQLDIENSLRFDNKLSVADISAQGIKDLAEHLVAQWAEGATPGQFGQIGGFSFSFDPDNTPIEFTRNNDGDATGVATPGERIQNLVLNREDGTQEAIVVDGELVVDPSTTYKMVILDFLAGGGDGYPAFYFENVVRLDSLNPDSLPNNSDLPIAGEQDALAEYLAEFFPDGSQPFDQADTPIEEDTRIQNLNFREDTIIADPTDPLLDTTIYRFRTGEGTYIYVENEERQRILQGGFNFVEEGEAFKVALEDGENLEPIYRFRNNDLGGAYLYVGEAERQSIRQNFTNFIEEGLAFYTYGADAEQADDIFRFQTQPGGYIFVDNAERQSILNGGFNFTEEGTAFEALV